MRHIRNFRLNRLDEADAIRFRHQAISTAIMPDSVHRESVHALMPDMCYQPSALVMPDRFYQQSILQKALGVQRKG